MSRIDYTDGESGLKPSDARGPLPTPKEIAAQPCAEELGSACTAAKSIYSTVLAPHNFTAEVISFLPTFGYSLLTRPWDTLKEIPAGLAQPFIEVKDGVGDLFDGKVVEGAYQMVHGALGAALVLSGGREVIKKVPTVYAAYAGTVNEMLALGKRPMTVAADAFDAAAQNPEFGGVRVSVEPKPVEVSVKPEPVEYSLANVVDHISQKFGLGTDLVLKRMSEKLFGYEFRTSMIVSESDVKISYGFVSDSAAIQVDIWLHRNNQGSPSIRVEFSTDPVPFLDPGSLSTEALLWAQSRRGGGRSSHHLGQDGQFATMRPKEQHPTQQFNGRRKGQKPDNRYAGLSQERYEKMRENPPSPPSQRVRERQQVDIYGRIIKKEK